MSILLFSTKNSSVNINANFSGLNSILSLLAISEFRNHKSLIEISIVSDKFNTFLIVFFQSLKSVEYTLSRSTFLIIPSFSVGSLFIVSSMKRWKKCIYRSCISLFRFRFLFPVKKFHLLEFS